MRRLQGATCLALVALSAACGSTVQVSGSAAVGTDGLSASSPDGMGQPGATTGGLSPGGASSSSGARLDGSTSGTVADAPGTGGTGGPSAPTGRAAGLPTKGFGWDASTISLGFITQEDQAAVIGTLGVNLNPGSVQRQASAIIADLNAHGGLLGRKLKAVFHDNGTLQSASDPNAVSQVNCADFTTDHPVVAVFNNNTLLETPNLLQCLKARRVPLVSSGLSTFDETTYAKYGEGLHTSVVPSLDVFVSRFVPELKANNYLGGWSTVAGRPATTPAKVGLLEPDTPIGRVTAALLSRELTKQGTAIATPFFYSPDPSRVGGDMQAAVLRFKADGVTHMIDITNVAAPLLFFASAAQQQRYFPRWGMTSWLLPQLAANTLRQQGTEAQLQGAKGVGWTPANDTDVAHDVADTPARRHCRQVLSRAGESIEGDANRFALFNGYALCDAVNLFVAAARQANALDIAHVDGPMQVQAGRLPTRATFRGSGASRALPATYRALAYVSECNCFQYEGPLRSFR